MLAAVILLQECDVTMTETLSPAELYQRIETLETRLAFQEDWLDTLDQTVARQAQRLDKLERISDLMRQRLREQQQGQPTDNETAASLPEDEIPPHY
jgi:SlyX protein